MINAAYERERRRLLALAEQDAPEGEYACPVFGLGPVPAPLMFLGEAPGREETQAGRPFVGKAGRQLDALMQQAGMDRAQAYVTNTVKYRPVKRKARSAANRTPKLQEVEMSLPLLKEELRLVRPMVVATLGNVPLNALLRICGEEPNTVGNVHGRPIMVQLEERQMIIFPLYHPASVIYRPGLRPELEKDMALLRQLLTRREELLCSNG